jgi:hypothetical protein
VDTVDLTPKVMEAHNPHFRVAIPESIIRPVLTNIITQQALASKDTTPDQTLLSFDANQVLRNHIRGPEARDTPAADRSTRAKGVDHLWTMSQDEIEGVLVSQRRIIVRLNARLGKLHPQVQNGRPAQSWLVLKKKTKTTVATSSVSKIDNLWLEVDGDLEITEVDEATQRCKASLERRDVKTKPASETEDDRAPEEPATANDMGQQHIWDLPVNKDERNENVQYLVGTYKT